MVRWVLGDTHCLVLTDAGRGRNGEAAMKCNIAMKAIFGVELNSAEWVTAPLSLTRLRDRVNFFQNVAPIDYDFGWRLAKSQIMALASGPA
jgi:hypothetical protein